jgi:hypothetical protein
MFLVAAGLIGLLLGVGLSLAADSIAGGHLSEPIPLQIRPDATKTPVPNATRSNDHQDSGGPNGAPSSETPDPTGANATAAATNDVSHDSGSGAYEPGSDSHGGSSGQDD